MALLSVVTIDLGAQSAVLTVTKSAVSVETITFASNQITFSQRNAITITGSELVDLINQILIFETALLTNFNINFLSPIPFNSVDNLESTDGLTWSLQCLYGANPRVVNYVATKADGSVLLQARSALKTILFPEWTYLLYALTRYKASVKSFLNI